MEQDQQPLYTVKSSKSLQTVSTADKEQLDFHVASETFPHFS